MYDRYRRGDEMLAIMMACGDELSFREVRKLD